MGRFSDFAARLREFIATSARVDSSQDSPLRADKDSEFTRRALELFELQFNANAPYGRFCEAKGVRPGNLSDWNQIPAMATAAFKEYDVSCLTPEERTTAFHSSGTTDQRPSRHFHNDESLALYEASLWPWFAAQLLADHPDGMPLLCLTPPPALAPHSSLVHMFETVRRQMGSPESAFLGTMAAESDWTLDLRATLVVLEEVAASGTAVLLAGTAFLFVHLLDELARRNAKLKLPSGSRVLETGGYKGRSRSLSRTDLHSFIAYRLGIPPSHIVSEYGMSELSSQAYDRLACSPHTAGHAPSGFHFPPWARVRIISPETGKEVAEGETGLIQVFDLANVWSVMAIQSEDLGIRRGQGFELVGRATYAEPRGCSQMSV